MGRTLLISHTETSWREWLKKNADGRDILCLDPAEPVQNPPGRLTLQSKGKVKRARFYGSLDPQRYPQIILAALAEMLPHMLDGIIQLPAHRGTPLFRHMEMLISQVVQPQEILMPKGLDIDLNGFPVGPETVQLEAAFPPLVQSAQRKAQWITLLEQCTEHTLELQGISIEGARLGSGKNIPHETLVKVGLEDAVFHAEATGNTLFLIADKEIDENIVIRAQDFFHVSKVVITPPESYNNLLCSFVHQNGEDFGMGVVECIDFRTGSAKIMSTAIAPAPTRILRLGSLRIDQTGNELGEAKPWQV